MFSSGIIFTNSILSDKDSLLSAVMHFLENLFGNRHDKYSLPSSNGTCPCLGDRNGPDKDSMQPAAG